MIICLFGHSIPMKTSQEIPAYEIDAFSGGAMAPYRLERFDGNRKFDVRYPHTHQDFYEILYIRHGSGHYTIDFEQYPIAPHTLFLLLPGQVHELEVSTDIEGYIFLFTQDFLHRVHQSLSFVTELMLQSSLKRAIEPWNLDKEPMLRMKVQGTFEQLWEETVHRTVLHDEAVRTHLELLLIYIRRHYSNLELRVEIDKEKKMVYDFRRMVEEHFVKNLPISAYAEMLHVSTNMLATMVRRGTGKSCSELIDHRTLLEIKRLLKYTDLTVSEMADRLHFGDVSYFTKYVKKHSGYTPSELKNRMRSV